MWLDENANANRTKAVEILSKSEYVGADPGGHRQFDDRHLRIRKGRQARRFRISTSSSATSRPIRIYSDAVWYLTQMRRWGQIPEAQADAWYTRNGKERVSPRYLSAAAKLLVADGKAKKEDFPWESDGFRAPTAEFIDNVSYDGAQAQCVYRQLKSGSRASRRSTVQKSSMADEPGTPRCSPRQNVRQHATKGNNACRHCQRLSPTSMPMRLHERARKERCSRVSTRLRPISTFSASDGLVPLARIAAGDNVKPQLKELRQGLVVPLIGIVLVPGSVGLGWRHR